MGVGMDVSSSGVDVAVGAIVDALGEPTVLVNNAGVNRIGPAETYPDDDWELVVNTNLTGVFRACRAFGSRMLVAGRGTIVNVASIIGPVVGMPGRAAYAASKGGVVGLTRTLGVEWAGRGVRVNAVLPGPVLTPMVHDAIGRGIVDQADVVGRTPAASSAAEDRAGGRAPLLRRRRASSRDRRWWSTAATRPTGRRIQARPSRNAGVGSGRAGPLRTQLRGGSCRAASAGSSRSPACGSRPSATAAVAASACSSSAPAAGSPSTCSSTAPSTSAAATCAASRSRGRRPSASRAVVRGARGLGFFRTFYGGLLTTCGIEHSLFMAEDTAEQYHRRSRPRASACTDASRTARPASSATGSAGTATRARCGRRERRRWRPCSGSSSCCDAGSRPSSANPASRARRRRERRARPHAAHAAVPRERRLPGRRRGSGCSSRRPTFTRAATTPWTGTPR